MSVKLTRALRGVRSPTLAGLMALLIFAAGWPPAALSAQTGDPYDIVLAGGRVMDPETGLDAIRWVGINGETVVAISETPLEGRTIVDATGLVVAPGFIDLHAHGQDVQANRYQAMDGVTTALEMESGVPDMGVYLGLRTGNAVLNFGATIAHGGARTRVMPEYGPGLEAAIAESRSGTRTLTSEDWLRVYNAAAAGRYEALEPEQYPDLWAKLEEGLEAGALGIGMPHQYYPGVTRDEIFRLFEFAADADVPIYTHVREMGVSPIQEVVANAAATGASLHIVHLNSSSLWDYRTNIDLILSAQERGLDITTEAYPYTAASTALQSTIFDDGWQDRLRISYGDLQWQDTGERLTEETFRSYREEGGIVIIHMMRPEWIEAFMGDPRIMVASDGMPYAPGAHPRSAGTFARFLGRYVREDGVLPLMDALAKITIMPARRLEGVAPQMRRKGRVQIGSDADLTLFDPARIIDTATFEEGLSYSEGVEYVLVNGTFVVRDGELVEGALPGRPVLGRRVVF